MISESVLVQRISEVLVEGKRASTYKHALLISLIDWVFENPEESKVPTRSLAELVMKIYWAQSDRFVSGNGDEVLLRQVARSNKTDAQIIGTIQVLRGRTKAKLLTVAAREVPNEVERALKAIETTLVGQPIPRLQTVGQAESPFLYSCSWSPKQSLNELKRESRDYVELLAGVPSKLRSLGPLFRPLIEHHWIRDVANWSGLSIEEDALRGHLFGSDRVSLSTVARQMLLDLHEQRCFYCEKKLLDEVHIDHFVPRSKYPNDAIENLVPSCEKCNLSKTDTFPSPRFVEKWLKRFDRQGELCAISVEGSCESNSRRSKRVARSIASELHSGSVVWDGPQRVRKFDEQIRIDFQALWI